MSDYTDEQAETFFRTLNIGALAGHPNHASYGRHYLRRLHDAGITVTFPEPRYYVEGDKAPFDVMDRNMDAACARFWGHLDGKGREYAQEHADRLNREAQA